MRSVVHRVRLSLAQTTTTVALAAQRSAQSDGKSAAPKLQGIRMESNDGFGGLDGFSTVGRGSFDAFTDPTKAKKTALDNNSGVLPCDVAGSEAAERAAQAEHMANLAATNRLPSPKRENNATTAAAPAASQGAAASPKPAVTGACDTPKGAPTQIKAPVRSALPSKSRENLSTDRPRPAPGSSLPSPGQQTTASPISIPNAAQAASIRTGEAPNNAASSSSVDVSPEVAEYYSQMPSQQLSKEEMWTRIQAAGKAAKAAESTGLEPTEAEYLKMEEELKEEDLFHFRVGEAAFDDEARRRDYYAMWQLATALNKARWSMMEIHSQRGVKTTGAGMRSLFWKESIYQIVEKKEMATGQFVDAHPILRPFAKSIKGARSPVTKTFVRGFADARLKVLQQPGNVKQLFDHFDKYYAYFFNVMMEVLGIKDEHAEHVMTHVGRAIGLTQHCVMFWKKYARLGFTLLPADLCADNHVNVPLLKNITLASRDRAVRKLLYDVMCVAKSEMLHAQQHVKHCNPKCWPILTECFYPNYYLGFLQRKDFNVSAMLADHNIENAGFMWYRLKKRWEWERYQSVERLLAEEAPLPYVGWSYSHRGSAYKMASNVSGATAEAQQEAK